jgi:hypothetical protein
MELVIKAILASLIAILTPVYPLLATVGFLIFADFIVGIVAAKNRGEVITSSAMRRTVSKILVYQLAILSGFLVETYLVGGLIPISKLAASAIGLVEIKSLFESANELAGKDIFKDLLKKLGSDNDK